MLEMLRIVCCSFNFTWKMSCICFYFVIIMQSYKYIVEKIVAKIYVYCCKCSIYKKRYKFSNIETINISWISIGNSFNIILKY